MRYDYLTIVDNKRKRQEEYHDTIKNKLLNKISGSLLYIITN